MDKHTLSNYGFVLVATIIVAALLAVLSPLTPFGDYVRSSISEVVDNYIEKTDIEDVDNKPDSVNPIPNGDNVYRKVTVNLLYEDGKQAKPTIVINVNHGDKVNIQSKIPNIEGYTVINIPKEEVIIKDTEYNVIYSKNSYSITYETNGGTIVSAKPTSYMYSEVVELPTNVVKEGTYFAGWYLNSDFSGNRIYKIDSNIKGDVTFYARWERNAFNVKYISNGKEITFEDQYMKVFYGESIVLPVMNAKNGLNFGGWYTNQYFSGGNVTQTPQYPEKDLVYYAYWTSEGFSITYETNGGTFTGTVPRTYTTGQRVVLPTCIEKAGYILDSWYAESSLKTKVTEIKTTDFGNKVFYAKWTPATYNITYDTNGGTASGTLQSTYTFNPTTSPLTYSTAISKPGYTFIGWKDVDLGTIETGVGKGRYGNIALIAQYSTKAYEITYNANGGTPTSSVVAIRYGNEYGSGPKVTKDGYEFDGWYTAASGGTKVEPTALFTRTSNQTLYAHWKIATYNIEYIPNGGAFTSTPTKTYNFGTGLTLPRNIEKQNYDFVDWYREASLTTKITTIGKTEFGNIKVYAKWAPKTYNITYNLDGGTITGSYPTSYVYGVGVDTLPTPTKSGYDFIGWENANGDIVDKISTSDSGNIALTAIYKLKEFIVDIELVNASNENLYKNGKKIKYTAPAEYGKQYSFSDNEFTEMFGLSDYYHKAISFKYTEQDGIDKNFHDTIKLKCYAYRTLNIELYFDNVKQDIESVGSDFLPVYKFEQSAHETAMINIPEFLENSAYKFSKSDLGTSFGNLSLESHLSAGKTTLKIYYIAYKFDITYVYDNTMTPDDTLPTYYYYINKTFTVPTWSKECYLFSKYEGTNCTINGTTITASSPNHIQLTPKFVRSENKNDHTCTKITTTKTATCLKTGTRRYTCADGCGYYYEETIAKNPSNHEGSIVNVGTAATHQEWNCCGLDVGSHSYTNKVTKAATCTTAGVRTYTCACGYSYTKSIDALGHSYSNTVYYANCTSGGYTNHKCTRCGYAYNDSWTNALGHSYYASSTTVATCTSQGYTTYTCNRCWSASYNDNFNPALGHLAEGTAGCSLTHVTKSGKGVTMYCRSGNHSSQNVCHILCGRGGTCNYFKKDYAHGCLKHNWRNGKPQLSCPGTCTSSWHS